MAKVYMTRVEKFNAAHKLSVSEWSDKKNMMIFGKCSHKNWHGHNYKLEVTVCGRPDPVTGFVMDAKVLGKLIQEVIIDKVDHKNFNMDVDFMSGIQPTAENIVVAFWNQLRPKIKGCTLHSIRLYETDKIYVTYKGE